MKVINKGSSVSNDIAIIMTSLAIVLKEMGQLQEAVTMYEEALAIRRKLFKGQSPYIAQVDAGISTRLICNRVILLW